MIKTVDMNQEKLRVRLLEIFSEYPKPTGILKMKEVAKEYDHVIELLDESLNVALGIMDAIAKKDIKDKKEEEKYVKEIVKELGEKSYLGGGAGDEDSEGEED